METLSRRSRTIPVTLLAFVVATVTLPLLAVAAVVFDMIRAVARKNQFMASRALIFGWVYLAAEVVGVAALFVVWLGSGFGLLRAPLLSGTYAVQRWWTALLLRVATSVFDLRFDVEGRQEGAPGPVIVLVRHASLLDTLLPAKFISAPHDIRLRYVLKKELLADPCLDIAGNRLPNYFVDRGSGERRGELEGIAELARGLSSSEGVVIFPEGTRFTPERRRRSLERLRRSNSDMAHFADGLHHVLAPRPAGTLAILEATPDTDVVILGHHGLEVLSHVREVWKGALVGRTIFVKMTRFAAATVPTTRSERVSWLLDRWTEVDRWIDSVATAPD